VGLDPERPGLGDFPADLYTVSRLALQELLTRQRDNSRQPRRTTCGSPLFTGRGRDSRRPEQGRSCVRRQSLAGTWTARSAGATCGHVAQGGRLTLLALTG
jgi:hypothetical protein